METEKYQKELFEFEPPKKAQARLGSIFPRSDFAITLTPEKMVFTAIGLVMLMVIFFALGVEKGRSAAYAKLTATKTIIKDVVAPPAISAKPSMAPIVVAGSATVTNITPKANPPSVAVKAQAAFDKTKPYMVVAAAFSKQDLALKEIGKLKTAGLDAFIYYGEPYYLACVGSFQSKESAGKILNKVRQMHKDAYVRLR
ncbi:MAG: SPOR domain-containing protein [Candidatus Omnitrophica bacterium]|nr:SPOR domain-containing protein [Candidatus Omnitrophota bacterium]